MLRGGYRNTMAAAALLVALAFLGLVAPAAAQCPRTATANGPLYAPTSQSALQVDTLYFFFTFPRVHNRTIDFYLYDRDAQNNNEYCVLLFYDETWPDAPYDVPYQTFDDPECADVYYRGTQLVNYRTCAGWTDNTVPGLNYRNFTNSWYLVVKDQIPDPANPGSYAERKIVVESPIQLILNTDSAADPFVTNVGGNPNTTTFTLAGMSKMVYGSQTVLTIDYNITTVRTSDQTTRFYDFASLPVSPTVITSSSNNPDPGTLATVSCVGNICTQRNSLIMPIADTVCDASGSYTIRSQARCADQTGTLVSVTGVDCSATRDFPFTLSATGLCDRLNQTLSIVGAMLLPIKPRFAVNETVALTFNLLYPDAVWQGFAGNVTFERLVVESVKNGENFTLVDDSAKTAVVDEIEFSVDGKPYTSNMYFDALLNPTIRFRPNIAVGGLIKPNQIYDVNLGFRVYLEFNIDWNRLVNGWQKRSFSIRQMMAPLTPGGVEAEFGIIPLTPTTTQPIVTEPGSPLPPWIPPVIIIVTVISVINSIAGTVGGFSGILAAVSSPTLSHGSNKDGPVSQTLDSSYITKTVPGLIDWVQYTQTIVITGALGLDTADIYPIFVSTMLWLFGIFKFLNPLAEVIYADGLAYGDTMDIAALYKRDGITPSYYGIERVALASGVRPRNVFLIIFLSFLIFEAAVAVLALAAGFACRIAMHYKPSARLHRLHELLPSLWLGTSLRVWNLYYTPIALGVAYQIALACRPELRIPIQVTVIAGFAALAVGLMVPGAVVWYTARTQPKEMLFDRTKLLASLGPLYNTYQPQLLMFFAAVIVYKLAIGIVAGAAYRFVWVQLAVLASFEVGYMLSVAGLKPHSSRARNFFELALSVLRLANLGLLCASVAGLGVSEQAKTATETASIVLQLCVAVGMGLVMLWSLLAKIMRWLWSTAKVAPAEVALVPGKGEMEEREPVSSPVPSPQTADGPAIGAGAEAGTHERRPRRSDRPNGGTRATSSAVLV